ncbi:MAG: PAS domain S-box-containing protein [Candidatus Azotimanducaceae bacterium]|jgi:PAS domain S-box-containing protein
MIRYYNLFSTLVLIASLGLLALLYRTSNQAEIDEYRVENEVAAEQVRLRLSACVQSRVNLVDRLASLGWESSSQIEDSWSDHASVLYPILPGIQALNFVDANWMIRQVYPVEPNLNALGKNLAQNKSASVRASVQEAESTTEIVRTEMIELLQAGTGFALYKKIVGSDDQTLGYVNGVFRTVDLMETCLSEQKLKRNFRFAVTESDGTLVYAQSASPRPWPQQLTISIDIAGKDWILIFAPDEHLLTTQRDSVMNILFLIVLALVLSMYVVVLRLLKQQQSLRDNQEVYRLLVENQSDMVVKVNMEGEFLYISPSYCKIFGKSEAELLNQKFMPLVHEDDRAHTQTSLAGLVNPPHRSYHEQRAMTKSGWRWLAWSNQGVLGVSGKLEAITAVGRDVTDVKALEERIAHTDKMKAIGEMAGAVTHDFNDLLQVMLGNLEFLIDRPDRVENPSALLVKVRSAVENAMQLTKKLSGLSRQQVSQRQVVDLNALMDDLLGLLGRTIPQSIRLNLQASDSTLMVRADPTQIEQVALNLCFNGRDAIESEGQIDLIIETVELDAAFCRLRPGLIPGSYACLQVRDDGKGMDSEELARIFDPFYTTKKPGEGTGLGLANCYSIIEQHNGVITAASELGTGTNFCIYLPALPADAVTEITGDSQTQGEQKSAARGVILVADDSEEVRLLACRQLQQAGYKTLEAENGDQAVRKFRENKNDISLVILDVVMPVMDGQNAAKQIRQLQPGVPLFFISGYSPEIVGGDDLPGALLKKPFKGIELRNMVRKAFELG